VQSGLEEPRASHKLKCKGLDRRLDQKLTYKGQNALGDRKPVQDITIGGDFALSLG